MNRIEELMRDNGSGGIALIPTMAATMPPSDAPACGNCRHYHANERPRDKQGRVDMAAPLTGECRETRHAAPIMKGMDFCGSVAFFAVVEADAPQCGRFEKGNGSV